MKESLLRRLIFIISSVLFAGFLIGQISGFFLIKNWFLNEQLKQLTPMMENLADEIKINNDVIKSKNSEKLILKAYDLENNEISINDNNMKKYMYFSDEEIKEDLLPYINEVLNGQKVETIESFKHITGKSIVIGNPIKDNGKIVGAIFAIKLASDFDVVLNGFYMVFFCASFVSTVIIIGFIYYFTRKLIKPLIEMVEVSNSMAGG